MVSHFPLLGVHIVTANHFVKDTSAFLIVIYSTKYRNHLRIIGVPRLIDQVVEGATVYFLMIFTGHILVVFFEFLAPVSDHPANICSPAHDEPHVGNGSAPSCEVSHRFEYRNKDEFDGMLSYP